MGAFDFFKKKKSAADIAEKNELLAGVGRIPFPAYRGTEPYIFISYLHKDSDRVFPLIRRFYDQGYKVWYDEGIAPGNEWTDEIAEALDRATVFLVFITPGSVASINVRNEIDYALDEGKHFLAVYLEDTTLPKGLKLRMSSKQAIMKYTMTDREFEYKYSFAFEHMELPVPSYIRKNRIRFSGEEQAADESKAMEYIPEQEEKRRIPHEVTELTDEFRDKMEMMSRAVTEKQFDWIEDTVTSYHGVNYFVDLPSRTKRILQGAFRDCWFIQRVCFPEDFEVIDSGAFENCKQLQEAVFMGRYLAVNDPHCKGVFRDCPHVTVYCHLDSPAYAELKRCFQGPIRSIDEWMSQR